MHAPILCAARDSALTTSSDVRPSERLPCHNCATAPQIYCPLGDPRSSVGSAGEWSSMCRVEPIEPLHAFARHPFARVGCQLHRSQPNLIKRETDLFNIENIIFASRCPATGTGAAGSAVLGSGQSGDPNNGGSWASRGQRGLNGARGAQTQEAEGNGAGTAALQAVRIVHTGRNLLFDAGCSVYGKLRKPVTLRENSVLEQHDTQEKKRLSGSARGPSMPLFTQIYRERCVKPTLHQLR